MKNLEQLKEEGLNAIRESQTLAALQQHRVLYLGKKGPIQEVMKSMKDLSAEERPKFGAAVNEIKSQIAAAIESKWAELEAKEMEDRLEREKIDITLEGYHPTVGYLERRIRLRILR